MSQAFYTFFILFFILFILLAVLSPLSWKLLQKCCTVCKSINRRIRNTDLEAQARINYFLIRFHYNSNKLFLLLLFLVVVVLSLLCPPPLIQAATDGSRNSSKIGPGLILEPSWSHLGASSAAGAFLEASWNALGGLLEAFVDQKT